MFCLIFDGYFKFTNIEDWEANQYVIIANNMYHNKEKP